MATDVNQRKRHRILDTLFRDENKNGYSVEELRAILSDHGIEKTARTIKSDIKKFKEEYHAPFDENLPKDGRGIRYRYSDPDFSVMENVLSEEDKRILAKLLGKVREYGINPNYALFLSLLEHVITGQNASDIELDTVQFSNNAFLKGIDEWFSPLLDAITHKKAVTLSYKPYGKEVLEYNISPYMLRQFNDRWFLIARIDNRQNLTSFAIDRIEEVDIPGKGEYIPCHLGEIADRFSNVYGVSGAFDKEPRVEKVVLKVASSRIGYIDTKPIHPDQRIEIIPNCPGWSKLTIPEIVVNKELISLLLSFGPDVEVVSPASLRETIKITVQKVLGLYTVK
ncbi:MAG: WYL domain-containing protein [Bacteroidales bacterium]|nr:WYL domain-containing protein [Bacteroidales bacterium]